MKKLFSPLKIGNLILKNRVIKAATHENLGYFGNVSDDLIDYHFDYAENGNIGLLTTGYVAVHQNGVSWEHQMTIDRTEEQKEEMKRFVKKIHEYNDQPISMQLGHCGILSKAEFGGVSLGPSRRFNKEIRKFCKKMTQQDIDDVIEQYIFAAQTCYECGFDAVELHFAHGYLVSEFLSSAINHRKDEYGGSLENLARLATDIISGVRQAISDPEYPILIKFNSTDCVDGGTTIQDSIQFAQMFEEAGASGLIPSQGLNHLVGRNPIKTSQGEFPLKELLESEKSWLNRFLISRYFETDTKFERLFLLEEARQILKNVNIPVVYVGGVSCLEDMEILFEEGFELLQIGRPLIMKPDLIQQIEDGKVKNRFGCIHCNKCFITIWRNERLECHWNLEKMKKS